MGVFLAALAVALPGIRAQSYRFDTVTPIFSAPKSIAVGAAGAIYVSLARDHGIYRVSPAGRVDLVAGAMGAGSGNGTGTGARFNEPRGLATDGAGNLYVADSGNHTIRKVTPAGVVSTVAGSAGNAGSDDGAGPSAKFNSPTAVALDRAGNLYVADALNCTLRRVTPGGVVTTIAGAARSPGFLDGFATAARFSYMEGLACDAAGNLYIADSRNAAIRKLTPAGVVSTLAGYGGHPGFADGTGPAARFMYPLGIAVDDSGTVFVCDNANYVVRRVSPAGEVVTLGGGVGLGDNVNGLGAAARFGSLWGIAVDTGGVLFLTDANTIKRGTPSDLLALTIAPAAAAIAAGSTHTFSVSATGAGPLSYQWHRNEAPIAGATHARLPLDSVQPADAGSYRVVVADARGSTTDATTSLTVLAPLPNDTFAGAQTLSGVAGSTIGRNDGATGEPDDPTATIAGWSTSTVWYRWTAPAPGTAVLAVGGLNFDVGVYTGDRLPTLVPVVRSDHSFGPRVRFSATAGTAYAIVIRGRRPTDTGSFTLGWSMVLNDDFAEAVPLAGDSGSVTASNFGASQDPGEDKLPGSRVFNSVWFRWRPSHETIAIFECSSKDASPLLKVYEGDRFSSLSLSDDTGYTYPNLPESVRACFYAGADRTYYIAVASIESDDQFRGGVFDLRWRTSDAPVLISGPTAGSIAGQPTSSTTTMTVGEGSPVNFSINVQSALLRSTQWYRNGVAIPGATGDVLSLPAAQWSDAGAYSAVTSNAAGTVTTGVVSLGVVSVATTPPNDRLRTATELTGGVGSVVGSNVGAVWRESGEPAHWGLSGADSSVWYAWRAPADGLAVFDTIGSDFDTVLAAYSLPSLASSYRVAQDDDSGGGVASAVRFAAKAGTTYYIVVASATNAARGTLKLNCQLSPSLAIIEPPKHQTAAVGGTASFQVSAAGSGVSYQWSRNGVAIAGATNSTFTVANLQAGADAEYAVTLRDSAGSVTSASAGLRVTAPLAPSFMLRPASGGIPWELRALAAGAGRLVAVGDAATLRTSDDGGRTWRAVEAGTFQSFRGVAFGGGQFVAVAAFGVVARSPDGATWSSTYHGSAATPRQIIRARDRFYLVGANPGVESSTDGDVWRQSFVSASFLNGIAWDPASGYLAACGAGGIILSPDGRNWSFLRVDGLNSELTAIAAVGGYAQFVAVGRTGTVVGIRRREVVTKSGERTFVWTGELVRSGIAADLTSITAAAGALFATDVHGQLHAAPGDQGPWNPVPIEAGRRINCGLYHDGTLFLGSSGEAIFQSEPLYPSRLANLSARAPAGVGESPLISGLAVTGTQPKLVLLRAAGPTLATAFGLTDALAAPTLRLFNAQGAVVGANAGWGTAANTPAIAATAARVGAFPFAAGSADSALLAPLAPGTYTLQVDDAGGATGLALVEAYDADELAHDGPRVANLSTRATIGADAGKLIAGFVLHGAGARRVLLRAVGPGLAALGVANALAEPQLELFDLSARLHASAVAWGRQTNADEIRGAFAVVGAFPLANGTGDAALLITLPPGNWTVQAGSRSGGSGAVLLEIYVLP